MRGLYCSVNRHRHAADNCANPSLDDIIAADNWAKQEVLKAHDVLQKGDFYVTLG